MVDKAAQKKNIAELIKKPAATNLGKRVQKPIEKKDTKAKKEPERQKKREKKMEVKEQKQEVQGSYDRAAYLKALQTIVSEPARPQGTPPAAPVLVDSIGSSGKKAPRRADLINMPEYK